MKDFSSAPTFDDRSAMLADEDAAAVRELSFEQASGTLFRFLPGAEEDYNRFMSAADDLSQFDQEAAVQAISEVKGALTEAGSAFATRVSLSTGYHGSRGENVTFDDPSDAYAKLLYTTDTSDEHFEEEWQPVRRGLAVLEDKTHTVMELRKQFGGLEDTDAE